MTFCKFFSAIFLCLALFVMSSCGVQNSRPAGYGVNAPLFSNHGYKEEKISDDTYVVEFQGNENNDRSQVSEMAMLRASELTLKKGYEYFVILDRDDMKRVTMSNYSVDASEPLVKFKIKMFTAPEVESSGEDLRFLDAAEINKKLKQKLNVK